MIKRLISKLFGFDRDIARARLLKEHEKSTIFNLGYDQGYQAGTRSMD